MAKFKISDFNNKHFLSLTGNGVMAVFATGLIGLLTRSLSIADVGIWFFFSMICALAEAIRSGFLGTATIKFYGGASVQRGREVLGSVWFLAIIVTALLALLSIAFMPFIDVVPQKEFVISIRWFAVTFISSLPFTFMYSILQADEDYVKILLLRLINNGTMVFYVIVLIVLKKMTLEALLWCNLLTNCFASVAGLFLGYGKVRSFFYRSRQCIMEIVQFGKYSMGSTVVSTLLSSTDKFLIPLMLGDAMLAIYSIALTLMQVVEIILRSFVATGISGMAIAYNQNNKHQVGYIMQKYAGMLIIAFIPLTILGLIFGNFAIYLLAGHKYVGTEAANIFRAFMILALFYPLDRFIGVTLDIIHKPLVNLYKVLVMLAFAFVGDLIGISVLKNLYGVVIASYFVTISGIIFGYTHLNKYLKISLKDVFILGYTGMKSFLGDILRKLK